MTSYCVYIHTSPSGKRYVGITSQHVNVRWKNGHGYGHNRHFTNAIKIYGWSSFSHEIVATGLSKTEAERIEKKLIKKYHTTDQRHGYNIKDGGDSNGRHSMETRRLMSEHRKGKGHPQTEETRRKISEHHGGGVRPKRVLCIETGVIYESVNSAAAAVGANRKNISKCCNGCPGRYKAGGYHWQYAEERT